MVMLCERVFVGHRHDECICLRKLPGASANLCRVCQELATPTFHIDNMAHWAVPATGERSPAHSHIDNMPNSGSGSLVLPRLVLLRFLLGFNRLHHVVDEIGDGSERA